MHIYAYVYTLHCLQFWQEVNKLLGDHPFLQQLIDEEGILDENEESDDENEESEEEDDSNDDEDSHRQSLLIRRTS